MSNRINDLIRDVVASPLGDIIASVGEGVAEAQQALDEGSLAQTLEIYSEGGEEALRVLREIGYRPTFYALPETTGEVRVSLRLGKNATDTAAARQASVAARPGSTAIQPAVAATLSRVGLNTGIKPRLYATPVDAGYSNRYGYEANVSAKLTFKIVPVPAPDGADELRVLPNFTVMNVTESLSVAESLGLIVRIEDSSGSLVESPDGGVEIASQTPEYSTESPKLIRLGDEIILTVQ